MKGDGKTMADENEKLNKTNDGSKAGDANTSPAGYGRVSTINPSDGTFSYSASNDILQGQAYKMYDNPQHLVGTQGQYEPRPGSRKIVNFRQDYVVLIRKKLFYAANAANQQIGQVNEDESITSKGNYMRTYKINNFTNISINHSILAPGTCSVTMKGNERVMCYEHSASGDASNPSVDELIVDTETGGIHTSYTMDYDSSAVKSMIYSINEQQNTAQKEIYANSSNNTRSSEVKATTNTFISPEETPEKRQKGEKSKKTSDEKMDPENPAASADMPSSDWKIAEKCDFEAMDEVWVFGKSNFERDESGEFKMNQIFFGYINDVKKTHASGGTNGCVISISAKDQLKLLELSYVSTQPSMIAGTTMGGAPGIDLRWGRQDEKHFGTVEVYNPYEVVAMLGERGADQMTAEQEMAIQSLWKSYALKDIFGGLPLERLIRQMCLDAGIPTWYLTERIEPIQFPPFTVNIKQGASDQVFSAATETRLRVCRRAVQDLLLEFFADEEGNIVMKCPNYALGANTKVKNNMGYKQLKGGLLNSDALSIYNLVSDYWAKQSQDAVSRFEQARGY